MSVQNPCAGGQGWWWNDRQIPGAYWPASLAKTVSPRLTLRACFKNQGREWQRGTPTVDLWPSKAWPQASEPIIHVHTDAYKVRCGMLKYMSRKCYIVWPTRTRLGRELFSEYCPLKRQKKPATCLRLPLSIPGCSWELTGWRLGRPGCCFYLCSNRGKRFAK